jgi:hypothetical protein
MNSIRPILFGLFLVSEVSFNKISDTVTIYHKFYSTTFSKSKHFPVVVKY